MSQDNENSYRSILKGMSIFGGVQLFQMLLTLVRSKFVAILLGPAGMGVNALFQSAATTISQISSLGLNLAIVKEVASVKEDKESLKNTVSVARRLTTLTALAGALLCFFFSSPLSRLTFGSDAYEWGFMLLSLVIFFTVAGNGMLSILQGLHEVRRLSRASIYGGIAGLTVGVPLYYWIGVKGVVPALAAMGLTTYLFYTISLRKVLEKDKSERLNRQEHKPLIKQLVVMGLILVSGEILGTLFNYGLNLIIRVWGNLSDIGLYQGANSLTNQYAGLVFMAMMMDYLPRLSAAANNNAQMNELVEKQLKTVTLIATPMLTLLIVTAPIVIRLLLSHEFMTIVPLMRWMALGVLIKAIMYPLGYITFAKNNRKVFFWMEAVGCNILTFGLNCIGYALFGLIGLGYALVADCTICLLLYIWVNHRLYGTRLHKETLRYTGTAILIGISVFAVSFLAERNALAGYPVMIAICGASFFYSLTHIRKLYSGRE